jgi:hypothetical protein
MKNCQVINESSDDLVEKPRSTTIVTHERFKDRLSYNIDDTFSIDLTYVVSTDRKNSNMKGESKSYELEVEWKDIANLQSQIKNIKESKSNDFLLQTRTFLSHLRALIRQR